MRHAFAVYRRSLGAHFRSMLEYPADFWVMASTGTVWSCIQFGFVTILFANVNAIGGWGYHEMLVLAGFLTVAASTNAIFWDGMWGLGRQIINGGMDYLIIRPAPVASQLGASHVGMQAFGEITLGLTMLVYGWVGAGLSAAMIPVAIVMLASAVVIEIALLTAANAANFWIKGHSPVVAFMLLDMQTEVMRFPLTMFPFAVRLLLTFGLPVAFASFIPVQVLTGRLSAGWLIGPPVAAAAAVAFAVWVFRAGLRAYDSSGH
ncbi:ABC transporter permease [Glycomyces arizonensis]|uniref:ABC transporter permease n=1 Tax=Glycomyces arizonensis TaxID=256035 RepID=UPI000407D80C|nr:ABC-2 family transporter protein [Glycomyces arizonensis]